MPSPGTQNEPCGAQRLATALVTEIHTGARAPGQRIETAPLASAHGVHPTDVTKALAVLRLYGYVRRVDGDGVYVADPLPDEQPAANPAA